MKRLMRLFYAVTGGLFALVMALVLPILAQAPAVVRILPSLAYNPLLIATTFAQTAPQTISEMTTEVGGFAGTIVPAWLVYVVFALIASLGIWLIGRAIRAMKH